MNVKVNFWVSLSLFASWTLIQLPADIFLPIASMTNSDQHWKSEFPCSGSHESLRSERTYWHRRSRGQRGEMLCWTSYFQTRKNGSWMWKLGPSFGCSDRETMEFRILKEGNEAKSSMDFRRADFGIFRHLFGRSPRETVLERGGVQKNCLIFKHCLLQTQEWAIPTSQESSKGSRRHAWMNKEILTKHKRKK